MKNRILALAVLVGAVCFLHAESKPLVNKRFMPGPDSYQSGAVYIASATNISGTLVISSRAAYLDFVTVSSGGAPGSTFELFDSTVATVVSSTQNPICRRVSYYYDAATPNTWPQNQGMSYGIVVKITTPAASLWPVQPQLQISYTEK